MSYTTPPLPVWGKNDRAVFAQKKRAQVKSRWYYIFWGTATFAVVAGQVYVGSGYRQMSKSFNRIVDTLIIEVERDYNQPRFY
tara:strand:- start:36 stop:284 length:249 start_codon:yes stop_codon:yes gene_type:complete